MSFPSKWSGQADIRVDGTAQATFFEMMLKKFVQLFKSCRKIVQKTAATYLLVTSPKTLEILQARSGGCTETAGTTGSSCFGGRVMVAWVMVDWRLLGYNDFAYIHI